jgi:hypothetical protein
MFEVGKKYEYVGGSNVWECHAILDNGSKGWLLGPVGNPFTGVWNSFYKEYKEPKKYYYAIMKNKKSNIFFATDLYESDKHLSDYVFSMLPPGISYKIIAKLEIDIAD